MNIKKIILLYHMIKQRFIDDVKYIWRFCWNRGIKLIWYKLWIREDEFYQSLDIDFNAICDMNKKELSEYLNDLTKRRQIAHERDLD